MPAKLTDCNEQESTAKYYAYCFASASIKLPHKFSGIGLVKNGLRVQDALIK
jgi:hypothetical protein